jgi:class 3 adenylate cyclase
VSLVHELPLGTVTFLFTDIEGSTQLLKQLRERYGEALEEHQRILREAFAEHGGMKSIRRGTRSSSPSREPRTRWRPQLRVSADLELMPGPTTAI